jgi:hypothetical protein
MIIRQHLGYSLDLSNYNRELSRCGKNYLMGVRELTRYMKRYDLDWLLFRSMRDSLYGMRNRMNRIYVCTWSEDHKALKSPMES